METNSDKKNKVEKISDKITSHSIEEEIGKLKGFNFNQYSEDRNNLIKLWIKMQMSSNTNEVKRKFIKESVKLVVDNFYQAVSLDCYPQNDTEQIFGMKGDSIINDIEDLPVDRAVIGAWIQLFQDKIIEKSQLYDALLNGNLPEFFKQSLRKYIDSDHEYYFNKNCSRVYENFSQINWDIDAHIIIKEIYSLPDINVHQFRKIKYQGIFEIAFGFDKLNGFFLSVFDPVMKYNKNYSKNLKEISKCIDMVGDGDGCYLSLHTGDMGFGKKDDIKDMKILWEKYEIQKEYIDLIN